MTAKISSYPYFTWCSIYSAHELIVDGLILRVGNETTVIWNDHWILGHKDGHLLVQNINTRWIIVDQLIDAETGTWKAREICNLVGN